MKTFEEWLKEMLSPVPFPALSTAQRNNLKLLNAMPTGKAKVSKDRILEKGSKDGDWR